MAHIFEGIEESNTASRFVRFSHKRLRRRPTAELRLECSSGQVPAGCATAAVGKRKPWRLPVVEMAAAYFLQ